MPNTNAEQDPDASFEPTENTTPYKNYGQYQTNPNTAQLSKYFTLNAQDLKLISACRTNPTKLGMAIQLCTMRFLSTFLEEPTQVPAIVIQTLSQQLDIHVVNLERYRVSTNARFDYRKLILEHLGCREFEGAPFIRVTRVICIRFCERPDQPRNGGNHGKTQTPHSRIQTCRQS